MGAKPLGVRWTVLVLGCLASGAAVAQVDPAEGRAVVLCTGPGQVLDLDVRFHDPRAVAVQVADPSSGQIIADIGNSIDVELTEPVRWRSPPAGGCFRLTGSYRRVNGGSDMRPAVCFAGDRRVGFAETVGEPLLVTVRFTGAALQASGIACAPLPEVRGERRKFKAAPRARPPPAAKNGVAPPAQIPDFPWPPPRPSTRRVLSRHLVTGAAVQPSLGSVADRLQNALESAGYVEYGYYRVPDGFALATRLERIYPDGRSMPEPGRWQLARGPLRGFDLAKYVQALFDVEQGHFRVIVFVVTSAPLTTAPQAPTAREALDWPLQGAATLPSALRGVAYGEAFQTSALIYEFQSRGRGHEASFNEMSSLTGDAHLRQAHILEALQ